MPHRKHRAEPKYRSRETLEIIIDTCSLGRPQLEGISKLVAQAMKQKPPIFSDYEIVIPIQIATEARQRIFPNFLRAELLTRSRQAHLEEFYQEHQSHVRLVETDTSYAYKFLFIKKASDILHQQPELKSRILQSAEYLNGQYAGVLGHHSSFDETVLNHLCAKIDMAASMQDMAYHRSLEASTQSSLTPQQRAREAGKHIIELRNLGRHGRRFFEQTTRQEEYLIQAMYSCSAIYKQVSEEPDFKRFRRDKGERAIENFLFSERSDSHPDRVSMVISDDAGARHSIQRLRSRSENSIFVVSSWGLALALKQLKLIPNLDRVVAQSVIAEVGKKHKEALARTQEGEISSMNDILIPRIERKWANRLVQVLQYGQWDREEKGRAGIVR